MTYKRKILDARWFNHVGIVQVETEDDEIRYYIHQVDGYDEELDKKYVADWGSSFPNDAGDVLFGRASCLWYEGNVLYGDSDSLEFVSDLIKERHMNSSRRSAEIK